MNNYQSKIRIAIQQASGSIKVAVSWLTDPVLVEELKQKARQGVNVEVIMSADEWNVLRFYEFKGLKNWGAKIRTYGPSDFGGDGFMHCKFCVIDGQVTLEGSYNWTKNAQNNQEQFRVDRSYSRAYELEEQFDTMMRGSNDYFSTITDPDAIIKKLEPLENKNIQPYVAEVRYDYERKLETAVLINTGTAVTTSTGNIIGSSTAGTATKTGTAMAENTGSPIASVRVNEKERTKNKPHRFYGEDSIPPFFHRQKFKKKFPFALYQKSAIEKTYDFLKCKVNNGQLICTGDLQPDGCEKYSIRIEFQAGFAPAVFITSHDIEPSNEIHIYKDGSLCLFYPGDLKWKNNLRISEYIIPWVAEWIVFYELWLMTGEWMGAEAPHSIIE
ncbi:phospholipase D-like domain-containing protein [Phaeodactylibacter xiamenensis]|uniref:phospholipase D-like domain-containing protein n=1 Tax=Phaeodactylibacter xiamenensis TaxID=1524460 RepID=UPI0024A941BF|nr:phospholipase D-like domain-containing protein [Phaeodactylibacter xiamenensis]